MIKKLFKKIPGFDKIEAAKAEADALRIQAESNAMEAVAAAIAAKAEAELAAKTPKERATAKGEPWVSVLDTHVNKDNIKNGFFELYWNELFIVQFKKEFYGLEGDKEEDCRSLVP